jgi:hypothetical protein
MRYLRHAQMPEIMVPNKHLRELCNGLAAGKLLPSHVEARVLHCDEAIPSTGRPIQADALIEFRTKGVQEEPITAVLEFKSRLTPLILEGTIHQLLGISNSLRASARYRDLYPMVGAPYISESIQNRCKELGIGYVDLNGTLLLVCRNIYVDVVRPATAYKNPQGIKRIFSGKSRRIARVLLVNPFKPFRLEEIASEAQLSVGQVFQVTKRLNEEGMLERTAQGRMLTKPRQLLRAFTKELRTDFLEKRRVFRGFTEMPPARMAEELANFCEKKRIRCAFTLSSGLEAHERNLREDVTAAYIEVDPDEIRNDLRLEAVGRGANVLLMTPPDADNTEAGGVFYKTRKLANGLESVNPIQLFVDFSLQGGRGEEQAEFLMEHTLGLHQ